MERDQNFYDVVLSTGAPVQFKTNSEVGSMDTTWITFIERGSRHGGAVLIVYFKDPPAYTIGDCTGETEFTMPPGPTRVWTVVKENEKIILLCNDVVIFDINYMTNTYRNERKCLESWGVDFEATRFSGSASDYYSQYTGGMFYNQYTGGMFYSQYTGGMFYCQYTGGMFYSQYTGGMFYSQYTGGMFYSQYTGGMFYSEYTFFQIF